MRGLVSRASLRTSAASLARGTLRARPPLRESGHVGPGRPGQRPFLRAPLGRLVLTPAPGTVGGIVDTRRHMLYAPLGLSGSQDNEA
ncbi:hypothetical protein AAFF_G00292080 [Aldrovandia affinis]|uniref:Uncharacterized protein n=1 Tax=Aldrovandia affinis TaxID=143900 RepID=A0AAD7WRU3_9TELE|nr:hypothetical protein AAFF_G00292080 [Aldrovandia affinis]